MTTLEKIDQLFEKILENNFNLLNQVRTLDPKDQAHYAARVSGIMNDTKSIVSKIKSPALTGHK